MINLHRNVIRDMENKTVYYAENILTIYIGYYA